MNSDWVEVSIDDIKANEKSSIAIGPFGSRMKTDSYVSDGVPVIRGNNLTTSKNLIGDFVFISDSKADELASSIVIAGDLVFPHRGNIGQVGIVPEDRPRYMLSTSLMKLSVNRAKVDPLFLFYFFMSPSGRHELLKNASQVGTPGIATPLASLRSIRLLLPRDLQEQRAIAHILGTLDDKIELNRRMNETLEAIARAIFKSWFVDFDPVRAKASGEPPESICRRLGLTPELLALFPDRFQDSELGEIPEGWEIATLGNYADLNPESWTKSNAPGEVEYVDLASTKWGKIEAAQQYIWKDAPSRAQRILRPGDTIIGTVRPGNGSFALIHDDGLTGSTGFAVLRPKKASYEEFVYLSATRKENIDRLAHLAHGAAYPAVSPEVVLGTLCSVAHIDLIIDQFGRVSKPLLRKTATNEHESRTLSSIRDTLLPKLLSGELPIP